MLSPAVAARLMAAVRRPAAPSRSATASARSSSWSRAAARTARSPRQLHHREATVKTHLVHLYAKLGVDDRAAAVTTAFERGLLTPGT